MDMEISCESTIRYGNIFLFWYHALFLNYSWVSLEPFSVILNGGQLKMY